MALDPDNSTSREPAQAAHSSGLPTSAIGLVMGIREPMASRKTKV